MALTGVQHAGYVDVNWKKIEDDVMTPLDMDGARASPRSRLAPPPLLPLLFRRVGVDS